ncbi:MAG: T9SS type A sorting domain-containing protein [Ignavibacterium sp.]|nr:T9SS type A sorting domain-containing protein [Ignavibacterium sp.]
MKNLQVCLFVIFFVSISIEILSQEFAFTYNAPSSITIPYGANSVNATYTFTYYIPEDVVLIRPRLSIEFDGNTVAGAICEGNDAYLPSSYTFNLTTGAHIIKLKLSDLGQQSNSCNQANIWQTTQINVTPKFTVRNENIFTVGSIYVDNYSVSKSSPYDRPSSATNNYAIGAIDQDYDGYHWIWNNSGINDSKWQHKIYNAIPTDYSTDRNTSYTVQSNDNSTKLIAGLRKIYKVNFQNIFVSIGNGGVIKVNDIQYNSPTAQFDVVELNPITATAVNQVINEIAYSFNHWSDGSTLTTRTFNPGSTTTYTAYFVGKPSTANRNLTMGTAVGQPIVLYWNEHPNTNVTQYKIWRKVKHNGVMGGEYLIATKNRGTTSYIDNDYALTSGYTDDLIFYDVRPYYSVENTYSDPNWRPVYGEILFKSSDSLLTTNQHIENSLSNYPNPFNPITTINFSIKESGFVNIKVFDLIGQQVAELVNEEKETGSYTVAFDASNFPSGVYIYTIHSGSFVQTRKMLLMK